MRYLPLFSLAIQHNYYANLMCSDFHIEPTLQTQKLLANYRCVLKLLPNGLNLFIQTSDQNTPFIDLPIGLSFEFKLLLRNPDFLLFTELSDTAENSQTAARVYTNTASSSILKESRDLKYTQNIIGEPTAFACVKITTNKAMSTLAGKAQIYSIEFKTKPYRWKYYVIVNNENSKPSIEDKNKKIFFDATDVINISKTPDPSDKRGLQLTQQYPTFHVFRLLSKSLVISQDGGCKTLLLNINGEKAVETLPSPPLKNYFYDVKNAIKEDGLYYNVKHFTQ